MVITASESVLDACVAAVAAAGSEPEVVIDPGAARAAWAAAPVVLVGADVLAEVPRHNLPRRSQVLVVGVDSADSGVYRRAMEVGAESAVVVGVDDADLVDRIADAVEADRPPAGLVAVVGGCGGAGATTLAAGLAVTAARRGGRPVLVDADPFGGGLDLVLGAESAPGLRWPDLVGTTGRVSATALTAALPTAYGVTFLSTDRLRPAPLMDASVRAVLAAARRAGDLVVVDLPRQLDGSARVALSLADTVLLVVPARVAAVAAASVTAVSALRVVADVRVVVRLGAGSGLSAGAVADALALPLAAVMRDEPTVAAGAERGDPPGHRGRGLLAETADQLLTALHGPDERGAVA